MSAGKAGSPLCWLFTPEYTGSFQNIFISPPECSLWFIIAPSKWASACNAGDPCLISGLGTSSGEGIGYPLQYSWASLWLSWLRICLQWGRPGFDPWVGKIPWKRKGYPLQYSGLENSMDCIVHKVAKSQTPLSDFHSLNGLRLGLVAAATLSPC